MALSQPARWLARLVLAWFVLSLAAAVASPVVKPQALDVVCSASGAFKLVVLDDEGANPSGARVMDCPLCLPAAAPPPVLTRLSEASPAPNHPPQTTFPAPQATRAAAPLPARGPPLFA